MATQNIPYTFSNGTAANANQVNDNFTAVKTFVEAQVVHVDGAVKATTNSYTDLSVTNAKIADATITSGKFASGIQPVILVTAVGSLPTGTDGMVAYVNSNDGSEGLYTHNGSGWRRGPGWNAPWGGMVYSPKTSNQTLSSAGVYQDITGLSGTFTAVANRNYQIEVYMFATFGGSTNTIDFQLCDGGATTQYQQVSMGSVFGVALPYVYLSTVQGSLGAGSKTFKVRARPDAGTTSTVNGAASAPSFILIKDIGPSGVPA